MQSFSYLLLCMLALCHSFANKSVNGGINPVQIHKLQRIASELAYALCIMREEGIIHGDIKPENIFIESSSWLECKPSILTWSDIPEDFTVKLGDFGSSVHVSEALKFFTDFSIQSLPYRSPEVLLGVPFGQQIDIWSVGVLLVELCTGEPMFTPSNPAELYAQYCSKVTEPSPQRYAGGRLYHDVTRKSSALRSPPPPPSLMVSPTGILNPPLNSSKYGLVDFSVHIGTIRNLFLNIPARPPATFIHLVAGLLHPDPDVRLTPQDFVRHRFIGSCISVPVSLIAVKPSQRLAELNCSIKCVRLVKKRKREDDGNPRFPSPSA